MINRQALLADLQKFLQRIEADLLERSESIEVPEVPAALHAEYEKASKAERTAQNYEDWRTDTITQAAAAWVLSCVFVRFLEDNLLIDPPKIAGPGDRLARARDEHELYFRSHPQHTDREYLLSIFADLAKLPGTRDIFGEHNAINDLPNWLSGDAAGELLNFFQKIDASTGDLVHDFTDPNWDTRFLGDLYQDLSLAARKKFALLQTPDFVEELILDRTLDPALEEFGLLPRSSEGVQSDSFFKMIDPACGSGHFLLGAFSRLLDRWQRKEPSTNIRELTNRVLRSIHGVDINPFAVAIARFRLLLAAPRACAIGRLIDSPGFTINVACGDTLLHGENRLASGQQLWAYAEAAVDTELYSHTYPGEDLLVVRQLLKPGIYHCVVANPPYIRPSDARLNVVYRQRFASCHGFYALTCPFMEAIFSLTVESGYTGQITGNSFMNNEFGRPLIEKFFPMIDPTCVIDTRYINPEGHGTPTVIIFGRRQVPIRSTVRVLVGIKGDQQQDTSNSVARVWQALLNQIDTVGAMTDYFETLDLPRECLNHHPWPISNSDAGDILEKVSLECDRTLSEIGEQIGIVGMTNADGAFLASHASFRRKQVEGLVVRRLIAGDNIRDWAIQNCEYTIFPYITGKLIDLSDYPMLSKWLWPLKTKLGDRATFGNGTYRSEGRPWWGWHQISHGRLDAKQTITFAYKSTHNHFALCSEPAAFNRTAPVITLKGQADTDHVFGVLGLLNSSFACFWERANHRQVSGARSESWQSRSERNITKVKKFPVCSRLPSRVASEMRDVANRLINSSPEHALESWLRESRSNVSLSSWLNNCREIFEDSRKLLLYLQEELDWECYKAYGLTDEKFTSPDVVPIEFGQRAFEIHLAREIANSGVQTSWFDRHGSIPSTCSPTSWPQSYKKLVDQRIEAIENNNILKQVERPEFKRRWSSECWQSKIERALREFLLLRLETYFDFNGRMASDERCVDGFDDKRSESLALCHFDSFALCSASQLADVARRDPKFMEFGEIYRADAAFNVQVLVEDLVLAETVPLLPILRYKDSGLRKRTEWEETWRMQRLEDSGQTVERISVPPEFRNEDFVSETNTDYWRLRGELDVPKERWISFPHCEGPDGTLVICWAGYDHLQQAQAISAYYVRVQTEFGGSDDPRLIPLLASLIELLPWLKQWHNEPNANFDGLRMGDYFEGFVNEEARNLGKTLADIKAWVPVKKVAKAAKPKKTNKKATKSSDDDGEAELLD